MKFHKADVLNDVWIQFLALSLLMALSVDSLNPVKAVSRFLGIPSWYFGLVSFILMLALLWNNTTDAAYRCVRVYLHNVLSISFKSIDVIGADNIPMEGPVIFTGNHANQFVDAVMVIMNSKRKVGFVVAQKSWHLPVIGHLARAIGCIPVVRPQDSVTLGEGTVKLDNEDIGRLKEDSDRDNCSVYRLLGNKTRFKAQIAAGDQICCHGTTVQNSGNPVKVINVVSDDVLLLERPLRDSQGNNVCQYSAFGILRKVDQSAMFSNVFTHLKRGNCIGIFPEGGSHDRTDLLPLKAGVSIMALGVKAKYNINAPVVPVGLTYFRGHRFRGRAVVEFGPPIPVDDDLMKIYAKDERRACNDYLIRVEEGMRAVLVTTPNYEVMQLIFTARRLYQKSGIRLSAAETQDLNRRFAEGYKLLSTKAEASSDLEALSKKLEEYSSVLKIMGLKDHQVPYIAWWTIRDIIGSALYGLFIFVLASIPSFVLNAPVGMVARHVARMEQQKALATSKVKLTARDVILSKKIVFSTIAIPALWFLYLLAAIICTDWYWSSIALLLLSFPLFSFFGVHSVEAGMIELKSILPLFYRLLPKYRAIQDELPRRRVHLQTEVRKFIEKYKDDLGPLAEPKRMDWTAYMRKRHPSSHSADNSSALSGTDKEANAYVKGSDVNRKSSSE